MNSSGSRSPAVSSMPDTTVTTDLCRGRHAMMLERAAGDAGAGDPDECPDGHPRPRGRAGRARDAVAARSEPQPSANGVRGQPNALCTIAGWGYVFLLLRELGRRGNIVIRRSTIKYQEPVTSSEIYALCRPVTPAETQYFLEMLDDKGQTKLDLAVEVAGKRGSGRFVSRARMWCCRTGA